MPDSQKPSNQELAASLLSTAALLMGQPEDSSKASKNPSKKQEKKDETDEAEGVDDPKEEDQEDNPPKKPKKKEVSDKDWSKADIYDFIKAKSLKLNYNPLDDCFTFMQSCTMSSGSSILLDEKAPLEDLEFTNMKSFASPRKNMEPSDEEMAKINQFTSRAHKKDEVRVLTINAASTETDRSSEKFSKKALEDMTSLSINKPIMNDHKIHDVASTFGNIFDAKVVHTKDGPALVQKAYMLNIPENALTIKNLEAGIGAKASVHFKTPRSEYICNSCNKALFSEKGHCGHYPGYSTNPDGTKVTATNNRVTDYLETSRTGAPDSPSAAMKMYSDEAVSTSAKSVKDLAATGPIITVKEVQETFYGLSGLFGGSAKTAASGTSPTLIPANPENGAKTTMPDEKPNGATSEDVTKFVGAVGELTSTAKSFGANLESQKSIVEAQNKLVASLVDALEKEKTARAAEVKEVKDRFDVLFAYQMKQAQQLDVIQAKFDMAASKSIDEVVHKLAAISGGVAAAQNQSAEDKQKSMSDNIYQDVLSPYFSKKST